jgi:hypothetical protein
MPPEFEKRPTNSENSDKELYIDYKGVKIFGLSKDTEGKSVSFEQVSAVLDRFPDSYWINFPLRELHFEEYEIYSANRSSEDQKSKVIYGTPAVYAELLDRIQAQIGNIEIYEDSDEIITRKRGISTTNDAGERIIIIFSTSNWDDKHNQQFDTDNSLFILAHELGHLTWKTISQKTAANTNFPLTIDSLEGFKQLPESILPRYSEYIPMVQAEFNNPDNGHVDLTLLTKEEDFAISHEHYFYWQDLEALDPDRYQYLSSLYAQF